MPSSTTVAGLTNELREKKVGEAVFCLDRMDTETIHNPFVDSAKKTTTDQRLASKIPPVDRYTTDWKSEISRNSIEGIALWHEAPRVVG